MLESFEVVVLVLVAAAVVEAAGAIAGAATAAAEEEAAKLPVDEETVCPADGDADQVPVLVSNLRPCAFLSRSLAFSSFAW